jgi:hypothetical protein
MELACLGHGTRAVCLAAGLNLSGLAADLGFPANTYAIRPLQLRTHAVSLIGPGIVHRLSLTQGP